MMSRVLQAAMLVSISRSSAALACTVCGQAAEESKAAYLIMTLIMSALPLTMAGGLIFWIVVRARRSAALEQRDRDESRRLERQNHSVQPISGSRS
jgi:hypothetical protein